MSELRVCNLSRNLSNLLRKNQEQWFEARLQRLVAKPPTSAIAASHQMGRVTATSIDSGMG